MMSISWPSAGADSVFPTGWVMVFGAGRGAGAGPHVTELRTVTYAGFATALGTGVGHVARGAT